MRLLRFTHMSLHFHVRGYDSLKLDEAVDIKEQIEGHFAERYQ